MPGRNAIQLAQDLLGSLDGLTGLQQATFSQIQSIPGIGCAKAAQLKAAIELGRRIAVASAGAKPESSPDDAAALVLLR